MHSLYMHDIATCMNIIYVANDIVQQYIAQVATSVQVLGWHTTAVVWSTAGITTTIVSIIILLQS